MCVMLAQTTSISYNTEAIGDIFFDTGVNAVFSVFSELEYLIYQVLRKDIVRHLASLNTGRHLGSFLFSAGGSSFHFTRI